MGPKVRGRSTSFAMCLVVLAVLVALPACEPPPIRHYEYVVSLETPAVLRVYDIDDGHRLTRSVTLPQLEGDIGGVAASAVTDRLYVSANGTSGTGVLVAFDLRAHKVVWSRRYVPALDGLCVTPDGRKIYVSSGETSPTDYFFVLDASDGDELGRIHVAPQTHNAVCNLNSTRAYITSVKSPYVHVIDTSDDHLIRKVGPFGDSVRPLAINGRNTLVVVNVNHFIGFEVGDITTGKKLFRVPVAGYPDDGVKLNPSHGVGLTPDEKEIWVVDSRHHAVHLFDATRLPTRIPTKLATITLSSQPQWITFSLDGRYAYPSTGDVIDTATRRIVGHIASRSSKLLEVDFRGADPIRASSRHGIGYVTG